MFFSGDPRHHAEHESKFSLVVLHIQETHENVFLKMDFADVTSKVNMPTPDLVSA